MTFVAQVRWATAGGRTVRNTHPFVMDGRVMAHNGGFGGLAQLDEELGSYVSVHSEIAISEPPAHLVPLPAGNPNIDT